MHKDKTKAAIFVIVIILVSIAALFLIKLPVANAVWMKQGEIVNLLNYHGNTNISEVELIDVAGDNNRTMLCGFSVDGEQTWIEQGDDRELNGIKIYVREIVIGRSYLEDRDYCKVTFTKPIITFTGSEGTEGPEAPSEQQETAINDSLDMSGQAYEGPTPPENMTLTPQTGPKKNSYPSNVINVSLEKPVRMSLFEILWVRLKNLFTF